MSRTLILTIVVAGAGTARADVDVAFYADTGAVAETDGHRANTEVSFQATHLDLFASSTAGRWSFLAETMFEAVDNEFTVDVERLQVGYLVDERLRLSVGRFHNAFGYYNDAFHHGAYYMLPVARPHMVAFEDDGGLIAAHGVGLHADGRFGSGDRRVRYDVEITNGRSSTPSGIQNEHDANLAKAALLRLRYEPAGDLDGLILGASVYVDTIPAPEPTSIAAGSTTLGSLRERLYGVHAAYLEHHLQVIGEAMLAEHHTDGQRFRTCGAFIEAGHAFDDITPYARYEWQRTKTGDPFYETVPGSGFHRVDLGVKHTTTANVALKLQAGVEDPRGDGRTVYLIGAQAAVSF